MKLTEQKKKEWEGLCHEEKQMAGLTAGEERCFGEIV